MDSTAGATSVFLDTPWSVRLRLLMWQVELDWLRPAWRHVGRLPGLGRLLGPSKRLADPFGRGKMRYPARPPIGFDRQ